MKQRESGAAATHQVCPEAMIALLVFACTLVPVRADAPVSGAPFLINAPLEELPSEQQDAVNPRMRVARLLPDRSSDATLPAHSCDAGDHADKKKCLAKPRGCMFVHLETKNPLKKVQESKSHCLPCELDGEDIPCWNPGAWVNGFQVFDCVMSCRHQQRIWQPEYACSDTTGFITQSQCFDRGVQSGSKCMFIAYEDEKGQSKSSCGPCALQGSGGWGCPATGDQGPEAGSKVKSCLSQCAVICPGPPDCPPTVAPPPLPPPPAPGVVKVSSPADEMLSAPAAIALPTVNPYTIAAAAEQSAVKAGFKFASTPPPALYYPVIMYRGPGDYIYTTGPPPTLDDAAAAAGSLMQAAAPAAKTVQPVIRKRRPGFLRRSHRQKPHV